MIIPKLKCKNCGQEKEIPVCCEQSMILKDKLLCCCSGDCDHHPVPECCGQPMDYA